jgi:bla regulator protein BlaR1
MSGFLFSVVTWLVQATVKGSAAIVLIGAAYFVIGRRIQARWWYALWLVVVLRLVVPIAPSSSWSLFNLVPMHSGLQWQLRGTAAQMLFDSVPGAPPAIGVPWWIVAWKWLALVWLGGFTVMLLRVFLATVRMQSLVLRALESGGATPLACRVVEEGRRQLGIRREVTVVESSLIDAPALHGVVYPTLLLPEGMCDAFAAEELRHVILHELGHLRRHDVAMNWLLTAVRVIHWFNPLAWLAMARVEEERELACDELTLSSLAPHERPGYGRTIVKILEHFRTAAPVPARVGIVNQKERMRRRLMRISGQPRRSPLMVPLLAVLSAMVLMALTDATGHPAESPTFDPAAVQTLASFDRPIDVALTNVSLQELLDVVSAKSGVAITQSSSVAPAVARQARFTLHAQRAPARALLTRALLPYGIVPEPHADAVSVTASPPCLPRPRMP